MELGAPTQVARIKVLSMYTKGPALSGAGCAFEKLRYCLLFVAEGERRPSFGVCLAGVQIRVS